MNVFLLNTKAEIFAQTCEICLFLFHNCYGDLVNSYTISYTGNSHKIVNGYCPNVSLVSTWIKLY